MQNAIPELQVPPRELKALTGLSLVEIARRTGITYFRLWTGGHTLNGDEVDAVRSIIDAALAARNTDAGSGGNPAGIEEGNSNARLQQSA
jgi:hypothetical protein